MDFIPEITHNGEGYYLTEEQWLLKQNVRELVEKEIAPRFKENYEEETADKFYHESIKKLGEAGFLRVWPPEALGGMNMGCVSLGIVVEEVARGNGAIAIHALENPLLGISGAMFDPEGYQRILDGELIAAFSMCSPEGQANYPEQADIATFDEETQEWVLNGEKAFCSGGTFCDWLTIAGLYKGETYSWVIGNPKDHPGVIIHHNPEIGASPTSASITMKNVRLPKSAGTPMNTVKDRKALPKNPSSNLFACCVAAMALGSASAAFDKTVEYLTNRTSNFKPIASLGQIHGKLAEMRARLEAARCLTYTALHMIDTNYKDAVLYTHLAKFYTCDMARWLTGECVQLWGNVGANPDSGISQHMMDAVVFSIGTGTSELHVNGAALAMNLPKSDNPLCF